MMTTNGIQLMEDSDMPSYTTCYVCLAITETTTPHTAPVGYSQRYFCSTRCASLWETPPDATFLSHMVEYNGSRHDEISK